MRINTDQLPKTLEKSLANSWLVAGDEPLLAGEAADAIRARARAAGFTGRELFTADRGFDWSDLLASSQALSLLSERRILEVRMPTPRPGKEGGAVLAKLAADPPPDTLLLVMTTRLEGTTYSTAWFKAFEQHGAVVLAWPVEIGRLPRWISERAARRGLTLDTEGAMLLAERVEGNLLAAHQEIEKLALLHPHSRLGYEDVQNAVANSARYDVFQLGEAALEGDAARSLRILEGLRAEGAEAPLILWILCRELRGVAQLRATPGASPGYGKQAERRAALLRRAVQRMAGQPLEPLFVAAANADRQVKGQGRGDAWISLTALVAALAGAMPVIAPAA
jgi:DNA polymerase-3 subunit delta